MKNLEEIYNSEVFLSLVIEELRKNKFYQFSENKNIFKVNAVDIVFSICFNYAMFNSSNSKLNFEGIENFLSKCLIKSKNSDLSIREICFNVIAENIIEDKQKFKSDENYRNNILKTNIEKWLIQPNYIYHGTNSVNFKNIKKQKKLLVNNEFDNDISLLKNIFNKNRVKQSVGIYKSVDKKMVFYSYCPDVAYNYGLLSPAWFYSFVDKVCDYGNSSYGKQYNTKDCLLKFDKRANQLNLSDDEKLISKQILTKYLDIYENKKPVVIAMPNTKKVLTQKETKTLVDKNFENYKDLQNPLASILSDSVSTHLSHNSQAEDLNLDNAEFFTLPNFEFFDEKLNSLNLKDAVNL